MLQFLQHIHVTAKTEIVFLLMLGIVFQMTDGSPFEINKKWEAVWSTDLPREYFSPLTEKIIKTGLIIIVAARCGTTYPYVASAMFVVISVLKDRAPKLILPWLFIAGVKSVCMTFCEALIGVYVCSAFGKIHKACIEFFISKALEIVFAAYLWGSVLSFYQDMERRLGDKEKSQYPDITYIKKMDLKRKRARSLLDESTLYKTACLNNFEFKDVPKIILQMLRRADEMSQDSLLGPGMMLASVSNMGSFDNLKTSESLGELGSTNLQSTKVIGLDEEESLSPPEKALKFLKMTWSDVKGIQQRRRSDVFAVNSDLWFDVTESEAHVYKPKQTRTEIVIRDLTEPDLEQDSRWKKNVLGKIHGIKFGVSLFNLIKKHDLDEEEDEESFTESQEEAEDREEGEEEGEGTDLDHIIMSNINEEKPVNRIGYHVAQKPIKGTAYYRLYKKDFMSIIGPEVFDRATKLPKVTSFAITKRHSGKISWKNNSAVKHITYSSHSTFSEGKMSDNLSSEIFHDADDELSTRDSRKSYEESVESFVSLEEPTNERFTEDQSEEEKKREEIERIKLDSGNVWEKSGDQNTADEFQSLFSPAPQPKLDVNVKKTPSVSSRKRRTKIDSNEKLQETNSMVCVSTTSSYSNNTDGPIESQYPAETDTEMENADHHNKTGTLSLRSSNLSLDKSDDSEKEFNQNQKIYFLISLLHKSLPEILREYFDLKNMHYTKWRRSTLSPKQLEFMYDLSRMYYLKKFGPQGEFTRSRSGERGKMWKSKVLKTADAERQIITGDFSNKIDYDEIDNKFLEYKKLFLKSKTKKNNSNVNNVISFPKADSESTESLDDKKQTSKESGSSKLRNELCRKYSKKFSQNHTTRIENSNNIIQEYKRNFRKNSSEQFVEYGKANDPEKCLVLLEDCPINSKKTEESDSSEESDEPISLYYSKAADLASPLLDMKKFIYPDHIHYSYKHVNKKGFDVNISGDLPLLVQTQDLTTNNDLNVVPKPESEITKRPMDLSFAKTDAFAEWRSSDQNVSGWPVQSSINSKLKSTSEERVKRKKERSNRKKTHGGETALDSHHVFFPENYPVSERIENICDQSSKREHDEEDRTPTQISSTQLHSNKGRINSTYNPALRLQENKREAKKKMETQQERTKEMLARLEREILFQNKSSFNSSKSQ